MYFWNVKALVEELKTDQLTEKQKFMYLLVATLIASFFMEVAVFLTPGPFQVFESLAILFIIAFGIWYCFFLNQQRDNKNFLERYICLSLPVSIRFFVFVFFILCVLVVLEEMLGYSSENTIYEPIGLCFIEAVYFYMLGHYIKLTSTQG